MDKIIKIDESKSTHFLLVVHDSWINSTISFLPDGCAVLERKKGVTEGDAIKILALDLFFEASNIMPTTQKEVLNNTCKVVELVVVRDCETIELASITCAEHPVVKYRDNINDTAVAFWKEVGEITMRWFASLPT